MGFWLIDQTGQSGDNASMYGGGGGSGSMMGDTPPGLPNSFGNTLSIPSLMPPMIGGPGGAAPGTSSFGAPSFGATGGFSPYGGGGGGGYGGFGGGFGGGGFGGLPGLSSLESLFGGSGGGGGLGGLFGGSGGGLGSLFGGGGGFGGGLYGPASTLGGMLGSGVAGAIGGSGPNFNSGSAGMGGNIGGMVGGLGGSFFGPAGTFAGAALGDLIGSLMGGYIGGGLPKMAKPQAAVGALEGSGNWVQQMLGKYIQRQGIGQGYDLSQGAGSHPGFNPQTYSNMLQLLSGLNLGSHGGKLVLPDLGFKNPVTLYGFANQPEVAGKFSGFDKQLGQLSPYQIESIAPELRYMATHGNLRKELGPLEHLAYTMKARETY
jgi:hypothetical protein